MKHLITAILILFFLALPAHAAEFTAPAVPESGSDLMPDKTGFGEGLLQMLGNVLPLIRPDLAQAAKTVLVLAVIAILTGMIHSTMPNVRTPAQVAGVAAVTAILIRSTDSLIRLAGATVTEIGEYGKLLLPVMTAAMAAQGGITASASLYAGTALFTALLGKLISLLFLPLVYIFLALGAAHAAAEEEILKRLRDMTKNTVSWCLKTLLTVFTTYMGITGVVSGTTDAAALKATKVTISTVVPVVGSILSDASESILVSVGLAKNAAGIYGIFAVLAVFLLPFVKIGTHYLLLKAAAALCSLFGPKRLTELIGDFSSAMGLLLGMTGSTCLLQLISTICFLRGVG